MIFTKDQSYAVGGDNNSKSNKMISPEATITIFCVVLLALLIFLFYCYSVEFFTWMSAFLRSSKEEIISLTKSKGHYNANGYIVHSESDIQLGATGSFKRFDPVDKDYSIAYKTTSFIGDWGNIEDDTGIPPQPLRPAPVPESPIKSITNVPPVFHVQLSKEDSIETTSISPIPRPVSSVNIATLASQSQFPICIAPPPSPMTPNCIPQQSAKFAIFTQGNQQVESNESTEETEVASSILKRALSCDSVCSDTSVALGDLEEPNITGYLCIGLEYDSDTSELIVNILEAKDLIGPSKSDQLMDTYVKLDLLPDKIADLQTRVQRSSNSPSYKERFLFYFNPREHSQRSLCFHVYCTDRLSHTLIGEGEIRMSDVSLRQPVTTWITLTDTGERGTEFGELMFSISYLPTAERLTVVVVKARNLRFSSEKVTGDSFVKVYLMQQGKKILKKKTSTKKAERCPIFNESMIFSVPAHTLSTIQVRLTVVEATSNESSSKAFSIGHVIVGAQASGRSLVHWNQMLSALRKPVAMWHSLRK